MLELPGNSNGSSFFIAYRKTSQTYYEDSNSNSSMMSETYCCEKKYIKELEHFKESWLKKLTNAINCKIGYHLSHRNNKLISQYKGHLPMTRESLQVLVFLQISFASLIHSQENMLFCENLGGVRNLTDSIINGIPGEYGVTITRIS